jgi:hypothetical protein
MVLEVDMRNPHIAVGVGLAVLVAGSLLFRDAGETALKVLVLTTFLVTFGTLALLDARDERRERRDPQ